MNALERRQVLICSSWLISAIIHFSVTVAVAIVQRPTGKGDSSASDLHVSWATAEAADIEAAPFTAMAVEVGPGEDLIAAGGSSSAVDTAGQALNVDDDVSPIEMFPREAEPTPQNPLADLAFSDVEIPARAVASPNRRAEEPEDEPPPAAKAEFFGAVAQGDRFVYVLDMSGSMGGASDQPSRFDRAREELLRSVEQLNDRQGFFVVLFSDEMRPMFGQDERQFLRATPASKDRLKEWLMKIKPDGGTNPNGALALGVSLHPSAIFMLSDGNFEVERSGPAGALFRKSGGNRNEIIDRSHEGRIPIHTVAFEDVSAAPKMQQLSKETGGSYRFVPEAGKEKDAQFIPPDPPPQERRPAVAAAEPESDMSSPAAQLLASAKEQESRRHYRQALELYRRIIAQFPGTDAAQESKERARRLGGKK